MSKENRTFIVLLTGIVGAFGFGLWRTGGDNLSVEQPQIWVEETGSMEKSADEAWWVNSGAYITKTEHGFQTIQGELSWFSPWRFRYIFSNARDTDNGAHPQNIFRLIGKEKWENGEQTVYFKINNLNLSQSPERNAWSGIFLFQRYKDGDNVYYAGLRQDGAAVIKKKTNGVYYTMAYKPLYGNGIFYNRNTNPNLIPGIKWIGLKTVVRTNEDGSVLIRLLVDRGANGNWEAIVEARDRGSKYGGEALKGEGHGGIRSDFMDMDFRDYARKSI